MYYVSGLHVPFGFYPYTIIYLFMLDVMCFLFGLYVPFGSYAIIYLFMLDVMCFIVGLYVPFGY